MKKLIGNVVKAQGIKGEVKVLSYLSDVRLFASLTTLCLNNKIYNVNTVRTDGSSCCILFHEVRDRNMAEALVGCDVFAEETAIKLPIGSYFVDEILGCTVKLSDGTLVGTVDAINQYGSADVYSCGAVSFPFLTDLVVSVDINAKQIILDKKRYFEVVVDDNAEVIGED
jgi:16S rRNA processing protein RimM